MSIRSSCGLSGPQPRVMSARGFTLIEVLVVVAIIALLVAILIPTLIDARDQAHWEEILRAIGSTRGARVIGYVDRTLQMHQGGKIEQHNKYPLKTRDDLSMAYTPGVARVCLAIAEDRTKAFQYTIKRNTVAVVSDGSAVLGLGDIGPEAAMPVMEGKAMLFKEFADVDAFPLCVNTKDVDEIVHFVKMVAPTFGPVTSTYCTASRVVMCSSTILRPVKRSTTGPSTSSMNAFSRSNTSIAGSVASP